MARSFSDLFSSFLFDMLYLHLECFLLGVLTFCWSRIHSSASAADVRFTEIQPREQRIPQVRIYEVVKSIKWYLL